MAVDIRKGMPSTHLEREEFEKRFRQQFFDPAFDKVEAEIAKIAEIAWQSYDGYNKNPRKQRAGEGFADPDFELPVEWLAAREAIRQAEMRQKDPASPSQIPDRQRLEPQRPDLPRRNLEDLAPRADVPRTGGGGKDFEVEVLDLSLLASEADKRIFPCKACVSTAQPLCHWPCTCYPNFALGQVNDWMAEIYPKWVAAHGVMIVTPVNWYQAPSSLKLMIDRLVCADGGNSDPTTTKMKHVAPAKELELAGWPYPRHLAGRAFSVAVHGDAAGVENLRRILCDWMSDIGMIPCGHKSQFGAYVGYLEPYATSHKDLDEDTDFQEDVKNSAHALINGVKMLRKGELRQPDATLEESRPK